MSTQNNPRRYGKSTLVTNAFLAEAEAGKSVRFESPKYVCLSRKALSGLLKAEEKRINEENDMYMAYCECGDTLERTKLYPHEAEYFCIGCDKRYRLNQIEEETL